RELEIADTERGAARERWRLTLDSEQKLRADQDPFDRAFDPRVETAVFAPFRVERPEIRDVGVSRRTTVRAFRQREQDLLRAAVILGGADEDTAAARRIARRLRAVRPADRDERERRLRPSAAHARTQRRLVAHGIALDERDADQPRPRFHRN